MMELQTQLLLSSLSSIECSFDETHFRLAHGVGSFILCSKNVEAPPHLPHYNLGSFRYRPMLYSLL